MWRPCGDQVAMARRCAARPAGLASGLALAVRPAGAAEAPALKGGSRRSFLRSGQKGPSGALDDRGAAPDNARRSGPAAGDRFTAIGAYGTTPAGADACGPGPRRGVTAGTADLRERASRPGGGGAPVRAFARFG